ncbi:MAG: hypothetical protein U0Y08_15645 [Bacteroidia bacterium]
MNFFETLTHNPIFPIATFAIGILVRTYFYYKSKKSKVLKYVLKSYNLVKDHTSKFSGLNIQYKNEEVKNFTVTKMIFWNSGKGTIDGKDITSAEPLTLTAKDGCRILEATILKSNNTASLISVSDIKDNNSISLSFDYLDYLDGAVLNILHDGTVSDNIEFKGKIKGLEKVVKTSIPKAPETIHIFVPFPIHKDISKHSPNKRRLYYGLSHVWMGFFMMLLIGIAKVGQHYFPDSKFFTTGNDDNDLWFMLILCGLIMLNGFYIMSKKLPKELDMYEDI